MMTVRGCSSAEPKVALLLPRAGATGSCRIVGRCLSTVRMQPGRWEDDGIILCYLGKDVTRSGVIRFLRLEGFMGCPECTGDTDNSLPR